MFHHLKSPNARAAGFCRAQPLLSRELSSAGSYRLICRPSSALSRTAPSFHPSLCSSLEQGCWKGKRRLNIHRGPTGAARDPRKLRERRGRHTPQHLWAHFSVDLGSPYTHRHRDTCSQLPCREGSQEKPFLLLRLRESKVPATGSCQRPEEQD